METMEELGAQELAVAAAVEPVLLAAMLPGQIPGAMAGRD
jgi:hypothetical protein